VDQVELLAPAGNFEKLQFAIEYGADAVYLSGKKFGLRAGAGNFSLEELPDAFHYIHSRHKKGYVTLNIFAHNPDFDGLGEYVQILSDIGVDAVIVADYGIFKFVKQHFPSLPIHISTQANVTNLYAVQFWEDLGAKRVTLARELSIKEIEEIRKHTSIELEIFAHGAMCMSYSGRCMLSNYLKNRDANKGDCAHICRWEFKLVPIGQTAEEIEIMEDERGTYLLNSNDLWTIPILEDILKTGIHSIKIEGRMKSIHYVSLVTSTYRKAVDLFYKKGKLSGEEIGNFKRQLEKVSHRNYFTGFYEQKPGPDSHNFASSKYQSSYKLMGVIKEVVRKKVTVIECRASFHINEELILISPADGNEKPVILHEAFDATGRQITETKPNQIILVPYDKNLRLHGILAKKIKQEGER
jgi:putative protease